MGRSRHCNKIDPRDLQWMIFCLLMRMSAAMMMECCCSFWFRALRELYFELSSHDATTRMKNDWIEAWENRRKNFIGLFISLINFESTNRFTHIDLSHRINAGQVVNIVNDISFLIFFDCGTQKKFERQPDDFHWMCNHFDPSRKHRGWGEMLSFSLNLDNSNKFLFVCCSFTYSIIA